MLFQPHIKTLTERKERMTCVNNLRAIGKALYVYAKENQKKFPSDIETLYKENYLADQTYLDCPATSKKGSLENPEYIYSTDLSVNDSSESILLKDAERNHTNGENVLTVSGHAFRREQ